MKVRRIFLLLLVLLLAVAGAYSSSFSGRFVFDDIGRIVNSTAMARPADLAANLTTRYLVDLTFAVDYAIGGLNPAYYHLTNLLLHLACVMLLFMLVRRLLLQSGWQKTGAEWAAFLTALLWGLHPLTTSAVTYICQRYEVMMAFFFLLSMFALAEGRRRGGRMEKVLLGLSALACLGGMFCKQVMITAPLILFMLDASFFWKGWRELILKRWFYYLSLIACWGALGLLITLDGANHMAIFSSYSAGIGKFLYLLNQAPVLLHYLRLVIWPDPLTIDYAWLPVSDIAILIGPAFVVAMIFVMVLCGFFRWPRAFFAPACAFVILSPTSSFIPIPDLAFEQRMYLPLAGVIVSAVAFAGWFFKGRRAAYAFSLISLLMAVAFGAASFQRNLDYAEPQRLWGDVFERIPHNFRAGIFLAEEQFRDGDLAVAEATVRNILARAEMAAADSRRNYNVPSSHPRLYRVMGRDLLGRILLAAGKPQEALDYFSEISGQYPSDAVLRHNRALALYALGRHADAELELDAGLGLSPYYRPSLMMKAEMLIVSGRHKLAAQLLSKVLESDSDYIPARVELAWLMGVSGDGAVRDGARALRLIDGMNDELGVMSMRVLDVQAAAYAETGDFARAVEVQERAVQAARDQMCSSYVLQEMEHRLELYRQGKPFFLEIK